MFVYRCVLACRVYIQRADGGCARACVPPYLPHVHLDRSRSARRRHKGRRAFVKIRCAPAPLLYACSLRPISKQKMSILCIGLLVHFLSNCKTVWWLLTFFSSYIETENINEFNIFCLKTLVSYSPLSIQSYSPSMEIWFFLARDYCANFSIYACIFIEDLALISITWKQAEQKTHFTLLLVVFREMLLRHKI